LISKPPELLFLGKDSRDCLYRVQISNFQIDSEINGLILNDTAFESAFIEAVEN
jgi:hypothetical protein